MKNKYNQTDRQFQLKQILNATLQKAFTLAEVLIALAVVGIIAQMTIPTLIASMQSRETTEKLKKAYATLSGAFQLSQLNGYNLASERNLTPQQLANFFVPNLNVSKNCGTATGCFVNAQYKYLNGDTYFYNIDPIYAGKAILEDGISMAVEVTSVDCTSHSGSANPASRFYNLCGRIIVDINNISEPNQLGRDLFYFALTKNGLLLPFGAYDNELCTDKCTGVGMKSLRKMPLIINIDKLYINLVSLFFLC